MISANSGEFYTRGCIPLTPEPAAAGVAAGVLGITPFVACPLNFCCDWLASFASFASDGGVRCPAPLGWESDDGPCCCDVKSRAWAAVCGCEMYGFVSMMIFETRCSELFKPRASESDRNRNQVDTVGDEVTVTRKYAMLVRY